MALALGVFVGRHPVWPEGIPSSGHWKNFLLENLVIRRQILMVGFRFDIKR